MSLEYEIEHLLRDYQVLGEQSGPRGQWEVSAHTADGDLLLVIKSPTKAEAEAIGRLTADFLSKLAAFHGNVCVF